MFKIYDEKYLADKLGVDRRYFHREIKPLIIRKFKTELKAKGISNPNIGLDKTGQIYLADPRNNMIYIVTGVNIELYTE